MPTVIHLCFGYAAVVTGLKPTGYSFLPQLSDTIAQQISIESAQPKLDLGVLKDLAPKKVMLGVIDLSDPEVETPEKVAEPHPGRPEVHIGPTSSCPPPIAA